MESFISHWFKATLTRISPRLNTEVVYLTKFHKRINLKDPKTLDEKIQWLKLNWYPKTPLVSQCADKYAVREYVESCGCPEILNELYFAYDTVEEIEWDKLPNSFVIKWNFGCGQNLIVRDKSKLDIEDAKRKLKEWYETRDTFYLPYSEMQYRPIPPKLIVEKLIETDDGNLPVDYKLYCFRGEADCVLVCLGRGNGEHTTYYFFNRKGDLLRYNKTGKAAPEGFRLDPMPENFAKLFDYAEKLSKPFPFVRCDLYLEKGKVIFGELTFTPCGGMDVNRLPKTQIYFGDKVVLPQN